MYCFDKQTQCKLEQLFFKVQIYIGGSFSVNQFGIANKYVFFLQMFCLQKRDEVGTN